MSAVQLRWRASRTGPAPADGAFLRPDLWRELDVAAIARLPVRVGRTEVPLGDLCEVSAGTGAADHAEVHDLPALPRIAALMTGGTLVLHGPAGDDVGVSLAGGRMVVHGNVGARAGGPDYTQKRGMTGGEIVIHGDAGDHCGFMMRRGWLVVRGACGASPGYRMLAGTIAIGRGPLDYPGLEMKRGTILGLDRSCGKKMSDGLAFREAGRFTAREIPALGLMLRHLQTLEVPVAARQFEVDWRLWCGDALEMNRGELWLCTTGS